MKRLILIIFFITCSLRLATYSCIADTISTKDNKEVRGIIIEDFKDRVLISTADGEKTIMKTDIKELFFDTEEQNLIKLAEQSRDRNDFIKAYVYYDKAFKLNPDSKQAKDGIVFLQGYLYKKDVAQKEEIVKRHNEFEKFGTNPQIVIKSDEENFKENLAKLKDTVGITLKSNGGVTQVDTVKANSPAGDAGIRKDDILIAVWGKLVGYMTLSEVTETLLEKNSLETKCTIERNIDVGIGENRHLLSNIDDLVGMTLKMQLDGLTVSTVKEGGPASEAGIKQNDLIVEINGNPTRYMPLKRAIELIKNSKGDTVNLILQRGIVVWGNQGG